jgi:ABC-2 type transport system ATP-binding protein
LDVIIQESAEGATVLFSSHQIAHLERAAEEVAIIDGGRVILSGNVDELRLRHGQSLEEIFHTTASSTEAYRVV